MEAEEWYNNETVKRLILPHLKFRESAVISKQNDRMSMRYLSLFNEKSLDIMFKILKFCSKDKLYNLYSSLARFKGGFPVIGYWGNKRKMRMKDISENYHKIVLAADFAIDIDAPTHKYMDYAYISAKAIKKMFDTLDVPYSVRFSGCGFHFIIPACYFKHDRSYDGYDQDSIYSVYRQIADSLSEEFSEFVDTSIYDMKRVLKVPYSLAQYKDSTYVCYPFNDHEDFESFKLENMKPDHISKKLNTCKYRIFNELGSVDKLLSRYGIKL